MNWWGKFLGGGFGFMIGGPLGALIGAAIGHSFDQGLTQQASTEQLEDTTTEQQRLNPNEASQERTQAAFFTACFSIMGYLAKIDGHISEAEITMAETVMQRMQLSIDQRKTAIHLFNQGKKEDFPIDDTLEQFRVECHSQQQLIQIFIEIQLYAAYADGQVNSEERKLLDHICYHLRFSKEKFARLENIVRLSERFTREQRREHAHTSDTIQSTSPMEAYQFLGVSPDASDAEIKRAYRKLMNEHHPDKLIVKGLPEEMADVATETTQKIRAAYDLIIATRKSKKSGRAPS